MSSQPAASINTVVIGGGQAGLSVGYHLARRGIPFVIVDAHERIGDAWRTRWDSLRLFTPNRLNGLDGMPFPAPGHSFATKDAMADYLESYAARFELPVRTGVRVDGLRRNGDRFLVTAGDQRFDAGNVVVAMSSWQRPERPAFTPALDPGIVQLHSSEYRNPSQLRAGGVLIVGGGNSGAEIAHEICRDHQVWLAGPRVSQVPFRPESAVGRALMPFVGRVVFHRILTTSTPMGRRFHAKHRFQAEPLLRVKSKDLASAGVKRVGRVTGVKDGLPMTDDGTPIDAANVIWCTGYEPGFSWIDLPIFENGLPRQVRGVVEGEPGLYFVGLKLLYAVSSSQIHGVGRDAARVVNAIVARTAPASRDARFIEAMAAG
ncbi:flavin-containing monooxygenase [Jiangella asiatica]|uniref:FAD-dependent oxidoreductase n=1 Tax=Jiangella asiatica TaxID=2530372 RepID=A0A4R5CK05_9ACTN|nr:FAD-dependent oxidoreductase [Jiangella asiatica]TDE00592.1 FAD-dependent oxidoreductase [Jiangella asiatica]